MTRSSNASISDLSTDARIVCGDLFAPVGARRKIPVATPEDLTDRFRQALDELFEAGVLVRSPHPDSSTGFVIGGTRYAADIGLAMNSGLSGDEIRQRFESFPKLKSEEPEGAPAPAGPAR